MVLVIGSINMDVSLHVAEIPYPGETVMAYGTAKTPGGKGANQAFASAKLGGNVVMLGCVGTDENGQCLLQSLHNAGVDTQYIMRQDAVASSSAYICVAKSGENSIVVDSSANNKVTPEYLEMHEKLFSQADYCVMQLEIPMETVTKAIELCKKYQVITILNPSPLTNFQQEKVQEIDYLIPNETEAAQLMGIPVEQITESNCQQYMNKNKIAHMIMTMGKRGCCYISQSESCIHFPASTQVPVDTTGAGDTFLGAFVAALSMKNSISESIRFANVASGLEITKYGTQQAVPTLEEVENERKKSFD